MKFLKEKKAQGALEYLLIIGGAIVLAAIVIAVVVNMGKQGKTTATNSMNSFQNVINNANKDLCVSSN